MPSKILVEQIAHTNETSAIDIDSSGNMVLQKDLKFSSQGTIKNSAGNAILQESGGNITLSNVRLPASGGISDSSGNSVLTESGGNVSIGNVRLPATGGISDSSGNAILSESGGTVNINNSTLGSNVNFGSIANDSISGDKINGGTISGVTLASTCNVRDADGGIPSGSKMLFQQTNAPVGWTKDTTHNNKALRVVTGTAGSGGNNSFTATFASISSGSFALNSTTHLASHRHSANITGGGAQNSWNRFQGRNNQDSGTYYTNYTGGNGSHSHSVDLRVQYVDLIIATKD